jgi:hypothetical protein
MCMYVDMYVCIFVHIYIRIIMYSCIICTCMRERSQFSGFPPTLCCSRRWCHVRSVRADVPRTRCCSAGAPEIGGAPCESAAVVACLLAAVACPKLLPPGGALGLIIYYFKQQIGGSSFFRLKLSHFFEENCSPAAPPTPSFGHGIVAPHNACSQAARAPGGAGFFVPSDACGAPRARTKCCLLRVRRSQVILSSKASGGWVSCFAWSTLHFPVLRRTGRTQGIRFLSISRFASTWVDPGNPFRV